MNGVISALAKRELVGFFRQPHRVVGSLAQPILIWLFLGSGFSPSFRGPGFEGMGYLEYFYPGVLLMMMLFASIFSTITIIEDRNAGLLQGVLVAPVSRLHIVFGKVLGAMGVALAQVVLLLPIAPFLGMAMTPGNLPLILGGMVLASLGFTTLGFLIAWNLESTAGFHAIMSVFLMPLWMLSGSLFPLDNAPGWLWAVMTVNPVTHALRLIRMPFYHPPLELFSNPDYLFSLAITAAWGVLCLGLALRQVNKQERGITPP